MIKKKTFKQLFITASRKTFEDSKDQLGKELYVYSRIVSKLLKDIVRSVDLSMELLDFFFDIYLVLLKVIDELDNYKILDVRTSDCR